ncbi:heme oxygenase [Virgibacillus dokdonensis]|uniref:heme oxygenase n=1 Tax=Virgibacillus dokdonensis TaxID=302167 RepID=UPI00098B6C0E|nr:heme oxygenase [Virgibacillus dokdonensis]
MYIVTNTTKIKKNQGHKLIERFNKVGHIESMQGFLGLEVLITDKLNDYDEVNIVTRWDSESSFKKWIKSDDFKKAHTHDGGKPEYIITNTISYYEVKIIRKPIASA